MLKAIHATEDVVVTHEKVLGVIEKLCGLRLTRAAVFVVAAIDVSARTTCSSDLCADQAAHRVVGAFRQEIRTT